jgi:hypothetical protein
MEAGRLGDFAQNEHRIRPLARVLAGLDLEIEIQAFLPSDKAAPVVLPREQHDAKIIAWSFRPSRHDPALML